MRVQRSFACRVSLDRERNNVLEQPHVSSRGFGGVEFFASGYMGVAEMRAEGVPQLIVLHTVLWVWFGIEEASWLKRRLRPAIGLGYGVSKVTAMTSCGVVVGVVVFVLYFVTG